MLTHEQQATYLHNNIPSRANNNNNNNVQGLQAEMTHMSQDHHHNNIYRRYLTSNMETPTTMMSTPPATAPFKDGLITSSAMPSCQQQQMTSLANCTTQVPQYCFNSSSNSSNSPSLCTTSSSMDNSSTSSLPTATSTIGVNLRVTGQCSQGGRKYMEDYFSVAYQQSENAKDLEYAFIGIYDGHGGAEAATFAKEHLMMEIINQKQFWSDNDCDVLRAIREGYIATHYAMWRAQDKWPKTANGLPSTAGTTATIAFIRREKIYIGHVGDSAIVLGYQNENEDFWRAKQLTLDHKPESAVERNRIMKSGGKVVVKSGVPRVVWNRPRNSNHRGPIKQKTVVDEIPFLAVARSLGDLWSYNSQRNEFVVSPDPDVRVVPINANTFRCIIFGTDGLWNVVSAQDAVNTVREKEMINEKLHNLRGHSPYESSQRTNPSKALVDQALRTWSVKKMRADNTSVVTVILYPAGKASHKDTDRAEGGCAAVSCEDIVTSFVPDSFGLEYNQMQAEVANYDDDISYKDMAMKYLPPEAYRNFNYYSDDSEEDEEAESDDSEEEEEEDDDADEEAHKEPGVLVKMNATLNQQYDANYAATAAHATNNNGYWTTNMNAAQASTAKAGQPEVVADDADMLPPSHIEREIRVVNYQNYMHVEMESNNANDSYCNSFAESFNTLLNRNHEAGQRQTAGGLERRNPISAGSSPSSTSSNSNSSNSSSSSTSSTNSNLQSVHTSNMHEILHEQQLYQQQCMSEGDGYSLTKLETRREQLTAHAQQKMAATAAGGSNCQMSFKVFHNQQQQQTANRITNSYEQPAGGADATATEQYYNEPSGSYMAQKPLALDSLLQQEREEEQQVALERLQQQIQVQENNVQASAADAADNSNIRAYACLQSVMQQQQQDEERLESFASNVTTLPAADETIEDAEHIVVEEEYLEEYADNVPVSNDHDETVQINEISSSSSSSTSSLYEPADYIECNSKTSIAEKPTNQVIEQLESIEILTPTHAHRKISAQLSSYGTKKSTPASICRNSANAARRRRLCTPNIQQQQQQEQTCSSSKFIRSKSSYLYYPNIPNENQKLKIPLNNSNNNKTSTPTTAQQQQQRRTNIHLTPASCSIKPVVPVHHHMLHMTPPAASSTPLPALMRRQLRSQGATQSPNYSANTPTGSGSALTLRDYGKRTLRTRNSLTKDLKAKTSLMQAALKYPNNAVTRNYLRTTAASLLGGNLKVISEHLTPTNRRSLNGNAANSRNSMQQHQDDGEHEHNSKSLKSQTPSAGVCNANSSNSALNATAYTPYQLNLRSRHMQSTPLPQMKAAGASLYGAAAADFSSIATPPPPPPSPVIKRASLSERRNLRSMHTRNTSMTSSTQMQNFSKSTRSQPTGSNLAAPPPSPKLINAAAAAAAATRARSLHLAKKKSMANNSSTSVVSAVFGKRSNLRSNGTSATPKSYSSASTSSPLPTRSTSPSTGVTNQTLRGRVVKRLKR